MIISSHFLVTFYLSKIMGLSGIDLILAFLFGVFIDIDHFFTIMRITKNPKKIIKILFYNPDKLRLRTPIQEPVSLILILPFSLVIRNYIPLLFWSIHILMDYLCTYEKRPFYPISKYTVKIGLIKNGTKTEWIISTLLLIITSLFLIVR